MAVEIPSATVVCHLCSTVFAQRLYLHSGSTPMSIVVVVSPLKALVLDQLTCKHLVHTGPGINCILVCPTSLYNRSEAAVALSELEHSIGSCNHQSGRNRVDKDRKVYCL